MSSARDVRISRALSFLLRHDPSAFGLTLDHAGWADVDALVHALHERDDTVSRSDIERVVRTSDKQRFALSEDGARIRANQGHSVDVDLALPEAEPPTLLFHGTIARFVPSIRANGLVKGERRHVHLSKDEATAVAVGARRKGETIVLVVRAAEMRQGGHPFFLSQNGVWLTLHVPPKYIDVPASSD